MKSRNDEETTTFPETQCKILCVGVVEFNRTGRFLQLYSNPGTYRDAQMNLRRWWLWSLFVVECSHMLSPMNGIVHLCITMSKTTATPFISMKAPHWHWGSQCRGKTNAHLLICNLMMWDSVFSAGLGFEPLAEVEDSFLTRRKLKGPTINKTPP